MKRRRVSWSELPTDLLTKISKRLNTRISILRFRAVCSTWRACCPLPPQNHHHFHGILDRYYLWIAMFTACTTYIVEEIRSLEAPMRWVVTVGDSGNSDKLSIRYPLSKYQVNGSVKSRFPKVLNLLDFRVTEIARYYGFIRQVTTGRTLLDSIYDGYCNHDCDKVLVFPDNGFDCAGSVDDLAVAVLGDNGSLKVFSPKDRRWTVVHDGTYFLLKDGSMCAFYDIVSFKGKICGLYTGGGIVCIDYESFELTYPFSQVPDVQGSCGRKRLVVSNGKLYCVVKEKVGGESVKVLEYNEELERWSMARNLGEQVFFLGSDYSFSISPQLCPELQGNYIYASRHSFRSYFSCASDRFRSYLESVSHSIAINDDVGIRYCHSNHDIGRFPIDGDGNFESLESFHVFWPLVSWVAPNASRSGYPRVKNCTSLRITSESEGKTRQETNVIVGPIKVAAYVNENIKTPSGRISSIPRSAEIAEREFVPVKEVVSQDEIMCIQDNENCEVVEQQTSKHQVIEESNPISLQVALHGRPSIGAENPGPANPKAGGLCKEDFEVPDAEVDLLQVVLDTHPEAFTRVIAKDAWARGRAVLPALRAYRLLQGGHEGSPSEAELHQAEGLVAKAENFGVEVYWLRQKLERSWEFCRSLQRAWH